MRFSRSVRLVFAFAAALASLPGCGGGYSSDEAKQVCDLEAAKPCSNAETTELCTACYEKCGPDCVVLESCPVQYACPAD
jgi:hypothetical protein